MVKRWTVPTVCLLLAFALRMFALNTRPMWYDEAFAALLAERDLSTIAAGTAADTMPPLYYSLLHFWLSLVGETPTAMRILSVGFSILTVAIVYAVGSRGMGQTVGNWAAFIAAIAPFQIYYGQELRMYSLLAFAGSLFVYSIMRLPESSLKPVVMTCFAATISLYAHNLAFLTLIAGNVFLAWRREWKQELKLVVAQVGALLLFVPWLVYVPGQVAKIQQAFWTQPPGLAEIIQMLVIFTTYLPLPGIWIGLALFVSVLVLALAALRLRACFSHVAPSAAAFWVFVAIIPPLVAFVLSYVMRPVFVARGVIVSSLAYYLLLAVVAARASRRVRIGVLATALMVSFAGLFFLYTTWGEWRRAPFEQANQFLRAQVRSGDLILQDNKLAFFPMHFYDRTLSQQYLPDPPGSANDTLARGSQEAMQVSPVDFNVAVQSPARVWFVVFQTALDQAKEEGRAHGNLARFDGLFDCTHVESFGDLRVYRYERRGTTQTY